MNLRMLLSRASATTSRGVGTFCELQQLSRPLHIFWEVLTHLLAVLFRPAFMYNVRLGMGDTTWVPTSTREHLRGSEVDWPQNHGKCRTAIKKSFIPTAISCAERHITTCCIAHAIEGSA